MAIPPFGWTDKAPPAVDAANLEADRAQIGAYADTVAVAAQAASAAGTNPTAVKTSAYNAVASDEVRVDISGGSVATTLPTAPADKTRVGIKVVKVSGSPGSTSATLVCGGSDVFNVTAGSTTLTFTALFQGAIAQYHASDSVWVVQSTDTPLGSALGAARLGTDGTVGGPSGSGLTSSVVRASPTGGAPAWVTGTVYALNTLVTNGGTTYICIVANTAGATFAGDLANWQAIGGGTPAGMVTAASGGGVPAWTPTTAYAVNQLVSVNGATYICLVAHTSGAAFSGAVFGGNWQQVGLTTGSAGGAAAPGDSARKGHNVLSSYTEHWNLASRTNAAWIRPQELSRKRVVIRNIGANPVTVAFGAAANNNYNTPSYVGALVIATGQEWVTENSSAPIFCAPGADATVIQVGVYVELGVL